MTAAGPEAAGPEAAGLESAGPQSAGPEAEPEKASDAAPQTVAAALAGAVARLAAAQVPDPRRDARLVMANALGVDPGRITLLLQDLVPAASARLFAAGIAAREARRPVSQIIGTRRFWGRDFEVSEAVLDPRPETETIIEQSIAEPFSTILDLGTGSGAILVTLLAERPEATGIGTDVSQPALDVANRNARALGVGDRATFMLENWFGSVTPGRGAVGAATIPTAASALAGRRFDLIVSNPPYIAADEMQALAPEVRDWEPHVALTPGGDGLGAYRVICAGAMAHLAPRGRILVEIGPAQAESVCGLFANAGFQGIKVFQDMDGRDRVVLARSGG